jgi:hypothetical protein
VNQIERSLFDDCLMKELTVLPCPIPPTSYGALIEPEGMHNRLNRAAIGKQSDDNYDQLARLAQAFHHGSSSRTKGLTAPATAIPLLLFIMNANVSLPDLASCGTRRIGAKLFRRVHWLVMVLVHKHIRNLATTCFSSILASLLDKKKLYQDIRNQLRVKGIALVRTSETHAFSLSCEEP